MEFGFNGTNSGRIVKGVGVLAELTMIPQNSTFLFAAGFSVKTTTCHSRSRPRRHGVSESRRHDVDEPGGERRAAVFETR